MCRVPWILTTAPGETQHENDRPCQGEQDAREVHGLQFPEAQISEVDTLGPVMVLTLSSLPLPFSKA